MSYVSELKIIDSRMTGNDIVSSGGYIANTMQVMNFLKEK